MIANFRAYACDYNIYQNCISIDSDRTQYYDIGGYGLNVEDSGFYVGDQYGATGNEIHGSISIRDLQMPYYIASDGSGTATISNSVALYPLPGYTTASAFVLENGTNVNASNILGMDALAAGQDGFYGKSSRLTVIDSILKDVAEYGVYGATNSYINHYNADGGTFGEGETTYDPEENGLLYPVRIEEGTPLSIAGENGGRVGPEILYMIGRDEDGDGISGLLYGEPGWDEIQDGKDGKPLRKLWPWPNEDKIKELMSETVEGVPGIYGFTAYESPFGSPNTLTSYIWEYLGNKIPDEIYGATTILTCPQAGGTCKEQPCSNYSDCTVLGRSCTTGYCCQGTCSDIPIGAPDTSLIKSVLVNGQAASEASSGDELTYTIEYQNPSTGSGQAQNVVITDTIPSGTIYVAGSCSPSCQFNGSQVSWTIPSVPAGGQGSVSFNVIVE